MSVNKIYRYLKMLVIFQLALSSCSYSEDPANLEPMISTVPAFDIDRTSSTIGATIHTRGTGELKYLHFVYWEDTTAPISSENIMPESNTIYLTLNNLKPGTSYHFFAEGGANGANIKSDTNHFSTLSNESPVVSGITPLSAGPVGLIVRFNIEDDGGEPITDAGCYVKNALTGENSIYHITKEELRIGSIDLYIGGLSMNSTYLITPFATNIVGEAIGEAYEFVTDETFNLREPGTLHTLLEGAELSLTDIKISGEMNGDDFGFLRALLGASSNPFGKLFNSKITSVDIANVKIVEGGAPYNGSNFTVEDCISTGLFDGCENLLNISLPMSATTLSRDAFKGCVNLTTLTVPASISELHTSLNCNSLENIYVSDANKYYKSVDGVLFDKNITELLWFPCGKAGEYKFPDTVIKIGENAFAQTSISYIELPPNLKSLSRGSFAYSSLIEIKLPDRLNNVPEGLFQGCDKLKIVHFGMNTEYLGNYLFDHCPLEHIYITAEYPPYVSSESFKHSTMSIFQNCVLHVPNSSKETYKRHEKWGAFNKIVDL